MREGDKTGYVGINNIEKQVLTGIHNLQKGCYTPEIAYMIKNDAIPENCTFYGVQVKYIKPRRTENGELVVLLFKCKED